ncbi:hypothetical protein [Phytoactinopolyspora mesophila]|uniref:Uncharacterized protein n=1 Tax=Phytoactinopolyspora mesophila TaxID=2650750 RepID=A0A7K3LX03_9ACTN|nr:hypothetical protein [Phytoactinopolyspora mesophila]NDL55533.1 hypothetical protein [Phytoactinopolyspora mesophila]
MSRSSDDVNEMRSFPVIDDATAEVILSGDTVAPEHSSLAEAARAIRRTADQPVRPSAELARRMASGQFHDVAAARYPARRRGWVRDIVAAAGPRARWAAGVAIVFTGLSGAVAAGAFPDAVQDRVQTVVEAVTPIKFTDGEHTGGEIAENETGDITEAPGKNPAGSPDGSGPEDPGEHGRENRPEDPGEHGRENRPEDPGEHGRENRPEDPGGHGRENRPEDPGEHGRENRPEDPGEHGRENRPEDPGEHGRENRPEDPGEHGRENRPAGSEENGRQNQGGIPESPPHKTDRPDRGS